MKVINSDLLNEISGYFNCAWEQYYYDDKVKQVYNEMRALSDKYYENQSARHMDFAFASAGAGMKEKLIALKRELIDAIEKAKTKENQHEFLKFKKQSTESMLQLAKESNEIARFSRMESLESNKNAKRAEFISWLNLGLTALISVGAIITQVLIHRDDKKSINENVRKELSYQFKDELKNEIAKDLTSKLSPNEKELLTQLVESNKRLEREVEILKKSKRK